MCKQAEQIGEMVVLTVNSDPSERENEVQFYQESSKPVQF
jgi:hypothetical protein